jgi:hypothetical protein
MGGHSIFTSDAPNTIVARHRCARWWDVLRLRAVM